MVIKNIEYAQNEYDILSSAYEYIVNNDQNKTETEYGTEFKAKYLNSMELRNLYKELSCLFENIHTIKI